MTVLNSNSPHGAISDLDELLGSVFDLGSRANSLDTRPYEDRPGRVHELAKQCRALGDEACELFDRIEVATDPHAPHATDIAFIARLDLRHQLGSLRSPAPDDMNAHWSALSRCCSIRRRIVRALVELEKVLDPRPTTGDRLTTLIPEDLEVDLASRRVYCSFFRAIEGIEAGLQAGELSLLQVLRRSAASIAVVVGRDVYPELRLDDRRQLRSLQDRILNWMRTPPSDEFSARRLWIDVQSSVSLMRGIQRRSSLIAHDFEFLGAVLEAGTLPEDPQSLRLLRDICEREESLREALSSASPNNEEILSQLRRLRQLLRASAGGPSPSPSPRANHQIPC